MANLDRWKIILKGPHIKMACRNKLKEEEINDHIEIDHEGIQSPKNWALEITALIDREGGCDVHGRDLRPWSWAGLWKKQEGTRITDKNCVMICMSQIYYAFLKLSCQLSCEGLPAQEVKVHSLGREGPLEKGMTTHSSILAWRSPRTEEPGGLQSMGSPKSWVWLSD